MMMSRMLMMMITTTTKTTMTMMMFAMVMLMMMLMITMDNGDFYSWTLLGVSYEFWGASHEIIFEFSYHELFSGITCFVISFHILSIKICCAQIIEKSQTVGEAHLDVNDMQGLTEGTQLLWTNHRERPTTKHCSGSRHKKSKKKSFHWVQYLLERWVN